mmetsp:Transcript_62054/g.69471  ORF Transcript_62054/g.69471 Transcript_62054/m.69471 type:complete len:81 (-) Transcript_62054:489-731(-)
MMMSITSLFYGITLVEDWTQDDCDSKVVEDVIAIVEGNPQNYSSYRTRTVSLSLLVTLSCLLSPVTTAVIYCVPSRYFRS